MLRRIVLVTGNTIEPHLTKKKEKYDKAKRIQSINFLETLLQSEKQLFGMLE